MADSYENTCSLETELETLEAIYVNELTYSRNSDGTVNKIELLLHPATGHDIAKQYVCMTLVFTPSLKYPDEPPEIEIRNPRGIGEEEISSLVEDMIVKAEEMRGDSMLYTLIEMAKDSLTDGNIPHCPCVVCLEHFHNHDSFHRTSCYHYFHTHCLYKYLVHTRAQIEEEGKEVSERRHLDDKNKAKKIICPVCRSPLDEESLAVTCSPKELEEDAKTEEFVIPPSLKEQQQKMAQLYELQKAKGGIIDTEHERNKYLLNAEDRMPIRSQILTSMTASEDVSSRPLGKHTTERKKERSKDSGRGHSGSFQHHKSRGRSRGHGDSHSGKYHQERYNHDKSRAEGIGGRDSQYAGFRPKTVERIENKDCQPSRDDTRKIEVKTEIALKKVVDFSEGKETGSVKYKNERESENITRLRRDHYSEKSSAYAREKSSAYAREESGSLGRGLGSEIEDIISGNFEHDNRESQKQKDGRSGGYKNTESEQRHFSVRTDNSGSDRRRGPYQNNYPHLTEKDNKYEVNQKESMITKEKAKEVRVDEVDLMGKKDDPMGKEVDLKSKEDQSLRNVRDERDEDRVKDKAREYRGGRGGYKDTGGSRSSLTSSLEDKERDPQDDRHGASGYDRHPETGKRFHHNDYDEEYKRVDKEGGQRIGKEYGHRESGGYQRGSDNHRGRGSESQHKSSKFQDKRHFDKSHVRTDRPPQGHSYQYYQQQPHHHNRQGQERERVARQARNVQENRMRDESNQESEISIKDAHGTDTTSETGTQDDEEADLQNQATGPPGQMSRFKDSRKIVEVSMLKKGSGDMSLPVARTVSISDTATIDDDTHSSHYEMDCKGDTGRTEFGNNCILLGNYETSKCNEGSEDTLRIHRSSLYSESEPGINYTGCDEYEDENWDDEIDIYKYERSLIRPGRLEEYDRQVASRRKYYQDKLKARYEQKSARENENRRISENSSSKEYEFTTESLIQAKSMSQGEDIFQAKSMSHPEVTFQAKSVLELFKEQARKDRVSTDLKDRENVLEQTSSTMSENDEEFVSDSGCKYLSSMLTSGGFSLSSLDNCSVPLFTERLSPDNTEVNRNLDKGDADSNKNDVHKGKAALHQDDRKSTSQSFSKNFKKVPPLKFPKKNQNGKPIASFDTTLGLTATSEKFPVGETSVTGSYLQNFEQILAGRPSVNVMQDCSVPNNSIPPPQATSTTLLPPSIPYLSVPLVNSYLTSCLLNASMPGGYVNGFGFNPNLLSLYNTSTGNAGNLIMNEMFAFDHINNCNIAGSNMNVPATMGYVNNAGFSSRFAKGDSFCVGSQGTGDDLSSDSVNILSHGAK